MAQDRFVKSFYQSFKQNMNDLGLPAPETLFDGIERAVATIAALTQIAQKSGMTVTFGKLLATGSWATVPTAAVAIGELGVLIGGVTASFYVGACIGSLVVAVNDTIISEPLPMAEIGALAIKYNLPIADPRIRAMMQAHPEMRGAPRGRTYRARMEHWGGIVQVTTGMSIPLPK